MSDTTTNTITPEERAQWRRVAATAELCCLKNIPFPHSDVTRCLAALEAAEAEVQHARSWAEHLDEVLAERIEDYEAIEAENATLRAALENAESALSLAHHRKQYDLVEGALRKVCSALGDCRAGGKV